MDKQDKTKKAKINEKLENKKNENRKKIKKQKGEKNIIITLFKVTFVVLIFLLQIFIMGALYTTAIGIYKYAKYVFEIIKIITVLILLYRHDNASYKISWTIFIMFFPVVGVLVFYLWGNSKLKKKKSNEIKKIAQNSEYTLKNSNKIINELLVIDKYKYNQVLYMTKISGYPIYKNYGCEYFKTGESFFESLKKDLLGAKKYIFMEFYILSAGKLWDEILEILIQKVDEGVEVKLVIDSLGSLLTKPKNFLKDMEALGIELYLFNPFTPIINGYINYRDHRKIIVIDGVYGYTGGVNLADEYVNMIEKYGYWKDVGIKIQGEGVWNYTLMFLRNLAPLSNFEIDYNKYKDIGKVQCESLLKVEKKGYVLPYADGPNNRKNPVENIYIQTINYAKNYLYITTPYFIINEAMLTALLNSARSGVDVRVILPHIPDKKLVQMVTRSYYEVLLEAGIKVYEFKPGFIHSKTFVVDDDTSIVGTANLDYRSAHLNFECATWTYMTGEEECVRKDFEDMLSNCIAIDLDTWKKRPFIKKIAEAVLSAFSPML
ncbi:MAG: cardiolipin synthase [Clostridia bacterium]